MPEIGIAFDARATVGLIMMPRTLSIRLFAVLSLISQTFALIAACACSPSAPPPSKAMVTASCHDAPAGAHVSELRACCCDQDQQETRTTQVVTSDAPAAPNTSALPRIIFGPAPSSLVVGSTTARKGVERPRPPLRV